MSHPKRVEENIVHSAGHLPNDIERQHLAVRLSIGTYLSFEYQSRKINKTHTSHLPEESSFAESDTFLLAACVQSGRHS
jgi:hypothetical protein